jgi:hypothetical protein
MMPLAVRAVVLRRLQIGWKRARADGLWASPAASESSSSRILSRLSLLASSTFFSNVPASSPSVATGA